VTTNERTWKDKEELVACALTNVLNDLWYEENPRSSIELHAEEFRQFCESVLYSALKKGAK